MADPVVIELPKETWVKVTEAAVKTGIIWEMSTIARILMTTRDADVLPTDLLDAVHVFVGDCNFLPISADTEKYVYLYAVNYDGKVRADL